MLKGILNKGFVKYSLGLVILILCVFSLFMYVRPTSGKISDTGLMTGNDDNGKHNGIEVLDFYENGVEPQAPPQNDSGNSDSGSSGSDSGSSSDSFTSFSSGFGGGGGGGTVQCVPKHLECVNEQCILVSGAGSDKCKTNADCDICDPRTPGYWKNHLSEAESLLTCVHSNYDVFDDVLNQNNITYVLDCSSDCSSAFNKLKKFLLATLLNICNNNFDLDDTYGSETVDFWISHSIKEINNGASEMDEYYKNALDNILNGGVDCYPDYHTECDESDACVVVQGGGEDQCMTYEDCAEHYICDYDTFTCEKRPLSQEGDECEVVSEENLAGKTPDLAKLNGGTNVTSKVRTSDNVYATQSVDTNPAFIYLFWNFTIPSDTEIDNATLSVEHKESSATVTVEWWNGSSYVEVCDPPEYAVDTISTCDLSSYITTPQKANEIKIRLKYVKVDNCHGDVDWAYLEIGYSDHEFLDCFEKICDYENQTCKKVIPGTQGEACETYADCQMCGNGEVENGEECDDGVNNGVPCTPPYGGSCTYCNATCGNATLTDGRCGDEVVQQGYEQCEIPGTENNVFCLQATQNCSGKKLGTRDAYGNCTSECGCIYDSLVYYCIKGQCGAECAINSDCDDQNPHTVDTCNLETCSCEHETQPYCGDGNVSGSEQCELPNTVNNTYCIQNTSQCQPSGRKLGTRDAYGDCGSGCGCTNDPFVYKCVKDVCGAECDLDSGCPDYCDGSVKHTGRICGWCSTCLCSNGTSFNCNSLDGWYDTGSKQWVSTGECSEKEQKEQKYRDYNCGTSPAVDCYYTENGTKWIDTGQTRNKPNGTGCNDGLWCTDNDVCTAGSCGGSNKDCSDGLECTDDSCDETHDTCVNTPDDSECDDGLWCNGEETCDVELGCIDGTTVNCSDNNIPEIARCDNVPDANPYTWDYGVGFISECDEASDICTQGNQNLTHTCSVLNCSAQCDATHGCANSTCSQTYNDYCNTTKLVEYDSDKVKDSTTVNGSCQNSCRGNCTCTNCTASCSPPPTNTYCVKGVCNASCAVNSDCTCQPDGCIGKDYYDYPVHGACTDGCSCEQGSCTPSISYNDPRCSHKVCDYQLRACAVVNGTGSNECATWEDCEYCGNGNVEPPEQCELPSTANNTYCIQSTSQCNGTKLGTRDAYGNCNSGCGCNYDPFTYKCVKGQCGAQCAVNSDCKCQQQDGCVGIDYYDYPDYTTCNGNCACGECSPTIIECDSRCIGNCKVEVKSGHDMNPRWGYPYTATDDIWIMATDVSNGACDGLTFDVVYWWCSCPSQTPSQSSIEVMQSEWPAKYDRLCSADAANHGGTNPTHSLECADCGVRMYHPRFPADSGKKFWTDVGSCQGTFQIDLRPGCYDIGYVPALACAGQCEDHPIIKHSECSNMQCVAVNGAGSNQCTTDADCYYNACDWTHMLCVKTAGNLADECTTNADCATHYECTDLYTCERVSGAGINQCSPAKPTACGGFDDPRTQPMI